MNDAGGAPPAELRLAVRNGVAGAPERRSRNWKQLRSDLESMGNELIRDLAAMSGADHGTPSLCEGWTVRDVLLHLVAGDLQATDALSTAANYSRGSPLAEALGGGSAEDDPPSVLVSRFAEGRRRLLKVAADIPPEGVSTYVPWVAGGITAFALVQARVMETWIHGWDMRWPLRIDQPFDDRCWWLADIAVRHVPYALRLADAPSASVDLRVRLDGVGGGVWDRQIGQPPAHPVSIGGPAWAWVTWASRRDPAQMSSQHLTYASDDMTSLVMRTARSFA